MPHSILTLRCRFNDLDALSAELWEHGTLGVQEIELAGGNYEIQAYFVEPFDATALPGFAGWHASAEIASDDWQSAWQPVEVGSKLWLAPHWHSGEPAIGRLRVNVRPGQGSGTAYSEPTLLMLEILERELRSNDTLADIGTGSGILTAAAHALGVQRLFACDVDPASASEAAQTLAADGVVAGVWCGSPRSLASGKATVVAANLNAIQLEFLAPELLRILAPSGRLIIGGFTARSLARMQAVFPTAQRQFTRGNWQALAS